MDVERFDWSIRKDAVKTHHVDTAAIETLGEFKMSSLCYMYFLQKIQSKSFCLIVELCIDCMKLLCLYIYSEISF